MPRTRVKICGITRPGDAELAVAAGADGIGLVFYPPSPRAVTLAQARDICAVVSPFVTLVALTVDADAELLRRLQGELPIQLMQFHGNESPQHCAAATVLPWIKAVRMQEGFDVAAALRDYSKAAGLLLDAYKPGVPGGTGETFDWARVPAACSHRLVLAGGLNPGNVAQAIRQVRPYAVDVSGGVEAAPGIKDAEKVRAFIDQVRATDSLLAP